MKSQVISVLCVLHIIGQRATGSTCKRPPTPDNGFYSPKKDLYSKNESVQYFCANEYLISDSEEIVCNGNNQWAGNFPFCDKATIPEKAFLAFHETTDHKGIDRNYSTCITNFAEANSYLITFDSERCIYGVRLTTKSNLDHFEVYAENTNGKMPFSRIKNLPDCQSEYMSSEVYSAKSIIIRNKQLKMKTILCEVEIFFTETDKCKDYSILDSTSTTEITAYLYFPTKNISKVTDQNPLTCIEDFFKGRSFIISLKQPSIINAVRSTAKSEIKSIAIYLFNEQWQRKTECKTDFFKTDNQSLVSCHTNYAMKYIEMKNTAMTSAELCEVEVFLKSDPMKCSLQRFGIEHGNVIYNESHAWLQCDENYRAIQNVITCQEGKQWSDPSQFVCEEILCVLPTTPDFGHWISLNTNELPEKQYLSVGLSLKLKCNHGYKSDGTETIVTCLRDGTWLRNDSNISCTEASLMVSHFNGTSITDLQKEWLLYGTSAGVSALLFILLLILCVYIRDKRKKITHKMKENEIYGNDLIPTESINSDHVADNEAAYYSSASESVVIPNANNATTFNSEHQESHQQVEKDGNVDSWENESPEKRNIIFSDQWVESGYEYVSFQT